MAIISAPRGLRSNAGYATNNSAYSQQHVVSHVGGNYQTNTRQQLRQCLVAISLNETFGPSCKPRGRPVPVYQHAAGTPESLPGMAQVKPDNP